MIDDERFFEDPSLDEDPLGDLGIPVEQFELLSAFLDGELSPAEAQQVQNRLMQDPDLRQLYVQLSAVQAGFDRLPAVPDPCDVEGLVAQVLAKTTDWDWRRWVPRGVAAAVALGSLGLGTWAAWRWQPQPLVSIEEPPIEVAQMPASGTQLSSAERYLFEPSTAQNAFSILFTDEGLLTE